MIIRNSAKAIVIHNGRLLVTREHDADGDFYLLPGGGQHPGETLPETVRRECLEETGVQIEAGELLLIRECFLTEGVHRVEFMFACRFLSDGHTAANPDTAQTGVEWLPVANLLELPLYPETLREAIINHHHGTSNQPLYAGVMK